MEQELIGAVNTNNILSVRDILRRGNSIRQEYADKIAFIAVERTTSAECVEAFLEYGTTRNARNSSGNTLLHAAIAAKHTQLVDTIVAGRYIGLKATNRAAMTPLQLAAKLGYTDGIQILLKTREVSEEDKALALIEASRANMVNALRPLIEAGAPVNYVNRQRGDAAIQYAASTGFGLDALLKAGADPNIKGLKHHPLELAAAEGLDAAVYSLVRHGARLTPLTENYSSPSGSRHPLPTLTQKGHTPSVRLLLRCGIEIDEFSRSGLLLDALLWGRNHTFCELLRNMYVTAAALDRVVMHLRRFVTDDDDDNAQFYMRCLALAYPTQSSLKTIDLPERIETNFVERTKRVFSLKHIARTTLRRHFDRCHDVWLPRLPLPRHLVDYVSLREIQDSAGLSDRQQMNQERYDELLEHYWPNVIVK